MEECYNTTKNLAARYQQTEKPIKDKQGNTLTTSEKQLDEDLLIRQAPDDSPDIPPAESKLPIKCDKPPRLEFRKAIKTLKNGNATGLDGAPAEALKVDISTST